jgi:MraZ protein
VTIWVPDEFERWTESFLEGLNPLSPRRAKLTRYFAARSFDAMLDSAGRVTLNQPLLDHAGIDRDVVVAGNVNHLEVWDRGRWAEESSTLPDAISEIAESLDHPS